MRRLIPAAIAAAALMVTACGTTAPAHHAPRASQAAAVSTVTAPATPACDITGWEAQSPGTSAVTADMQAMQGPLSSGDVAGAAADGHQLFLDAIAAGTPAPPACAPVLRHAWHVMLFWYALAGATVYITGFKPGLVNRNYARAGRDVKRGLAQWDIVQAQETALGG